MKTDREYLDGIYQKSEILIRTEETKERLRRPFLYKSLVQLVVVLIVVLAVVSLTVANKMLNKDISLCSEDTLNSLVEFYNASDVVVEGEVISNLEESALIRVTSSLEGELTGEDIKVNSQMFFLGEKVLLFLVEEEGSYNLYNNLIKLTLLENLENDQIYKVEEIYITGEAKAYALQDDVKVSINKLKEKILEGKGK